MRKHLLKEHHQLCHNTEWDIIINCEFGFLDVSRYGANIIYFLNFRFPGLQIQPPEGDKNYYALGKAAVSDFAP